MTGNILRISEAASLGLHAAGLLGWRVGQRLSTGEIARILGGSEAHLSKVMQRLHRAGIVDSTRGPGGGFRLARPAGRITMLEVYEAVEGPLGEAGCLLGRSLCGGNCMLGDLLQDVHRRFSRRLAETTLAELAVLFEGAATGETQRR